jgi:hypothetical protein
MPWVSQAQRRWGNSPAGHRALGDAGVAEWNAASKGEHPPERAMHTKTVDLGKKGSFEEKPGALHAMLNVPKDEPIGQKRIKAAEHSSNPLLRRRAISAAGLTHMHHGS